MSTQGTIDGRVAGPPRHCEQCGEELAGGRFCAGCGRETAVGVSPSTGTGTSSRMGMRKPCRWEWIGQSPRLQPIALRNAKGYGTTRLGAYYPPSGKYTTGRFFNDAEGPHIDALDAAVAYVNGESIDPAITVVAENQCGLCGRKLEDPISIARGIGPECASKPTGSVILHASKFVGGQALAPTVGEALGVDTCEPGSPEASVAAYSAALVKAEAELDRRQQAVQDQQIECSRLANLLREGEKAAFAAREAAQEQLAYVDSDPIPY